MSENFIVLTVITANKRQKRLARNSNDQIKARLYKQMPISDADPERRPIQRSLKCIIVLDEVYLVHDPRSF